MRDLVRRLSDVLEPRTRRRLALAGAGSIVVALLDTVAIALVLPLVDVATGRAEDSGAVSFISDLLGTADPQRLTLVLTLLVVGLFILKDVGSLWFSWWLNGFVNIERVLLSARLLRYYLTAPYTETSRRSSAELMRTMDASVLQLFSYTVSGLIAAGSSAISIATVVVALVVLAPLPTAVLVAYFGLAAVGYLKLVKPRTEAAGALLNTASMKGWKAAFAALGAYKEVKLRGSEEHFVTNYREAQLEGAHAGRVAAFLGAIPRYFLEIFFMIAVGIVLVLSSSSSSSESSSAVGLIALFVAAGFRLLPAVTLLVGNVSNIRLGAHSLDIVRAELLMARDQPERRHDRRRRRAIDERLVVDDVWFRYPGADSDALRGVTIDVPKGSSLALVGSSGAGKTTLVDIILGLHVPTRGAVTVDGVDVSHDTAAGHPVVGYVPQEIFILDASLAENVAFDEPESAIDGDRVERALLQAELGDVVQSLPEGVSTWLGERGTRLSGGQRQRVGIARALYRQPDLLVLDEGTSALDNETEHRISQAIARLAGEITVIVVAHRLSTVRHVDQVVFLRDGEVRTTGSFEEVRAQNPEFARLVELGSLGDGDGP